MAKIALTEMHCTAKHMNEVKGGVGLLLPAVQQVTEDGGTAIKGKNCGDWLRSICKR